MRLDKYLKVSRLIKRRTIANQACENKRVTINGKEAKPSAKVAIDDVIAITFGNKVSTVRVIEVAEHVKKDSAKELYEII
ncbi:MAG: RNA-binding S4 domain-containing protein [Clostridiales bacterium]|nr:RNA-binding S4 domain-containing protein [Clostridiales bacterium]